MPPEIGTYGEISKGNRKYIRKPKYVFYPLSIFAYWITHNLLLVVEILGNYITY